ncbi:unnamed protein product [Pieris brassicae]|uniref:Retrotransposon gag domain-containing protein n=1 Tax=Pieris brassicae TaxID=7116 RepID=A0A9P0XAZ1_PIEBR|nr:unnamed protein product [Pieris brassicae]
MESRTLSPGGNKLEVSITDTEDENSLLPPSGPINISKEKTSPTVLQTRTELELSILLLISYLNSIHANEGKAETACSIKEFSNWPQLKEFLKTQFSERKYYTHLLTDSQECKQLTNEPLSRYALRIKTYLSKLLTEISINYGHKNREMYGRTAAMEELTLHHFQMGLSSRISNIVRCKSRSTKLSTSPFLKKKYNNTYSKQIPIRNNFQKSQLQHKPDPPTSSNPKSITFCRYCKKSGHTLKNYRKREYNIKFKSQNPRTP